MNFKSKFQIRFIKRMFMNEKYVKTLSIVNFDTKKLYVNYIVKLY